MPSNDPDKMRLDKWLWAARFYKTRTLACESIDSGRVRVNEQLVKPARAIAPGDRVAMRIEQIEREVVVQALSQQRGPAPVAQKLYEETAGSVDKRMKAQEQRRLAPEPALAIEHGRPTKRDRRDLERNQSWGDRWSASIDS